MKKVFVSNDEFPREITRSQAFGHKKIVIADDVSPADAITMRTEGTTLMIEKATEDSDEDPVYCILCKEFGLFGYENKFRTKLSYILCDDGWMLVTLINGAFVVNLNDRLLMPSVGVDKLPTLRESEVLWIDRDYLQRYSQYMKEQADFPYDFEFVVELAGGVVGGLSSFKFLHISAEDVDLSLGKYAQYLQDKENKERAKEAKQLQKQIMQNSSGMEFDEDDDEDDDYDSDYDDDDEDDDEYDNY